MSDDNEETNPDSSQRKNNKSELKLVMNKSNQEKLVRMSFNWEDIRNMFTSTFMSLRKCQIMERDGVAYVKANTIWNGTKEE